MSINFEIRILKIEMKNEKIKIKNEERQEKMATDNKADLYETTAKADRIRKKCVQNVAWRF